MALTKDQILNADDRGQVRGPYPVPEWGGDIYLRSLKASELDRYESSLVDADGKPTRRDNYKARFLILVLCDENGNRIFKDGEAGALGMKHARILNRLWDAARRFNGLDADVSEELEKNYDETESAGSISS